MWRYQGHQGAFCRSPPPTSASRDQTRSVMMPDVKQNFRSVPRLVVASLIVFWLGCSSPPQVEVVDLIDATVSADFQRETALIDCGTPEARKHLGPGWSHDERHKVKDHTFVWSDDEHSEIDFFLGWRRSLEVRLTGRPFAPPGALDTTVSVSLNGTEIDQFAMVHGSKTYSTLLPVSAQRVGQNQLLLSYSQIHKPSDIVPGSQDSRKLAAAWQSLEFSGLNLVEPPAPADSLEMYLPMGARVDYFLDLPADSRLHLEGLDFKGEGNAEFLVSVLQDQGHEMEIARITPPSGPEDFALPDDPGLFRIRFSVVPGGTTAAGWLRIHAPKILAPQLEQHPEPVSTKTDSPPRTTRPNLIIYLVDALRADRLGCYGNERSLSPRIDAFAEQSILFENAVAQSSWTKASVASIFTGLWPAAHGTNGPDSVLPPEVQTLPEALSSAGFTTAAISANAFVNSPFGFARGFDYFSFLTRDDGSSQNINQQVFEWINSKGREPFFLYAHTIDPHAPYAAPQPYISEFAGEVRDPTVGMVETVRGLVLGKVQSSPGLTRDLNALYDAEVAYNDAGFGAFLDFLVSRNLLENSVILFTSDHGEAFGEHQAWTHGLDLHTEVLHIPLLIRLPNSELGGTRVTRVAQHIDVAPTFLRLAGLQGSAQDKGRSLLEIDGDGRWATSYLDYWGQHGASIVTEHWKFIQPLSIEFGRESLLFDRHGDPRETTNLATQRPVVAGFLASKIRLELGKTRTAPTTTMDESTRSDLKALGYLQ